ncbi:MAG: hypothetical protein ACLUMK_07760 [Christensenellales bacterium]
MSCKIDDRLPKEVGANPFLHPAIKTPWEKLIPFMTHITTLAATTRLSARSIRRFCVFWCRTTTSAAH